MTYILHFSPRWEKEYRKLDNNLKIRIGEALMQLTEHPEFGKPLSRNLKGVMSLRVGKYRILYEINYQTNEVFLGAIGLRKNIYERF